MSQSLSHFARTHRFATLSIASLLFAGLFLACGTSETANSGSLAGTSTSGSSTTGLNNKTIQHFKVGDKVSVGDTFEVTVNSFKTTPGDDYINPAAGNQFVAIDITIKNISAKEQNVSSGLQLTFKDVTGQKYSDKYIGSGGGSSPDGKVAVGDLLRGQVYYEIPKTLKQFTLAFEADFLSSGQTIWDVSL